MSAISGKDFSIKSFLDSDAYVSPGDSGPQLVDRVKKIIEYHTYILNDKTQNKAIQNSSSKQLMALVDGFHIFGSNKPTLFVLHHVSANTSGDDPATQPLVQKFETLEVQEDGSITQFGGTKKFSSLEEVRQEFGCYFALPKGVFDENSSKRLSEKTAEEA